MPTVNFSKEEVLKVSGLKLSDKELKERISMMGTDLEEINNTEIIVEIFPNRPDLLSLQGFARALSSFTGKKTGLKKWNLKKSDVKVIVEKGMEKVRPYTVCAVVKKLNITGKRLREIIEMQEKLHITFARNRKKAAIGIYPLENIKPPIYFKPLAKTTKFIPLEGNNEMTGLQILSQHEKGRDYAHLLEGKEKFPFFIDSNNEIMSMPPIINSDHTGKINENTKEVFIEVSGFDLKTQGECLNIIVTSLIDMGGEAYSIEVLYPDTKITTPNLEPWKLKFDLDYINRQLGLKLTERETIKLLEKMGFGFKNGNVLIPCYRTDVLHLIDLVEDIAVAYGYENIPEVIPNVSTIGEESNIEKFEEAIRQMLVGMKLLEIKNYNISSEESQNKKMLMNEKLIKIKNSMSSEFNVLRRSIMASLMQTLQNNRQHEYPQEIFEIGTIFNLKERSWTEEESLSVLLAGNYDFTSIRKISDVIINDLGLTLSYDEIEDKRFISGRVSVIKANAQNIGIVGELNPQVLTNWQLEIPVVGLELNLSKLKKIYGM